MSNVALQIRQDQLTPAVQAFARQYGGTVVHQALAAGLLKAVQRHFEGRNQEPNRMGGPKQNFWDRIRQGTSVSSDANTAQVSIPSPIRQKLYGGTIRPVNAKAIAFPISPSVYGRTAREERLTGTTRLIRFGAGARAIGIIVRTVNGKPVGEALFLVVAQVVQQPDPRALPDDATLIHDALAEVERNAAALI